MPTRIPRSRLAWLEQESARWRDAGVIDGDARERIVSGYDAVSGERRGLLALVILAVLMCGIGLLLVIGYNWERIPASAKIAMILFAVAVTFAASAYAYAKGRATAGETLAFAGTLVYGNAIWLIAQVLHLQGHFPDAFLWFGIGTLVCAFLVSSEWIGVEAAVLFAAWLLFEAGFGARPIFLFLPLWALCVYLAHRLSSPLMLGLAALTAGVWVAIATGSGPGALTAVSALLAGCALFAAGRLAPQDESLKRAWQASGLLVMLAALVPLMVADAYRFLLNEPALVTRAPMIVAIVTGLIALAGVFWRPATAADAGVAAAAVCAATWGIAMQAGVLRDVAVARLAGTAMFSLITLVVSVTLIRRALHSNVASDLGLGVLFALAFLIIRWVSVIENLLWSGGLLLVAGGGLLLIARLWKTRHHTGAAIAGRA